MIEPYALCVKVIFRNCDKRRNFESVWHIKCSYPNGKKDVVVHTVSHFEFFIIVDILPYARRVAIAQQVRFVRACVLRTARIP